MMPVTPNCSALEFWQIHRELLLQPSQLEVCNWSYPDLGPNSTESEDAFLTKEQLLLKYLGPRRSTFFIPVCTTYLFIFVIGAFGNILTCTVIIKNKIMRTPTNYYLFSLAISDLLVLLLGMPLEIYEMWRNYPFLFGKGGCYFKTLLFETVCFASILNVTALSMERYIAVVHPLKAKYVMTQTHAKRVIITVWAVSILCSVPNTSLHGIFYLQTFSGQVIWESAVCMPVKPRWMYNLIIQVTTMLFFFIPMGTISALYLLIGLQLKKEKMLRVLEAKTSRAVDSYQHINIQQEKRRRRQVTKMLFVLVVVFGICWAPFHTDRLMWSFIGHWTGEMHQVFQYVHIISGVFFYLSSTVNPILYNLMSTRFHEMFKEVMCHGQHKRVGRCRKYSLSVTRAMTRSTVCEHLPNIGPPLSDIEDFEVGRSRISSDLQPDA
ncbi:neuromedin-U receptor 1 isoform X2 [Latimeria chalumnae]|uniref:neuromedin-U receptor 1 isoform X2 n=1 Tax=Latimeria chalumnae TaxID=7897 RepID=UPI0003C172AE|nr:PREDICTED: neuromedin-U receptor 1 isoform X2 [Latimeria chalumnae]|eukprot:XP_005997416.1 PREDICTED: neuromedin-U receptor 1 isoform X2 [Latimeria chalumnae]